MATIEELEKKVNELEENISDKDKEIAELQAKNTELTNSLATSDTNYKELKSKNEKLSVTNAELVATNNSLLMKYVTSDKPNATLTDDIINKKR